MPRDPARTFSFVKKPNLPKKSGLLIPGIPVDRAPSVNYGRLRRFWLYLSSEFIDADPHSMGIEELEAKSKFPLLMTLPMSVNHQGVPNVTEVEEWPELGLALRWDQEATVSQHSLRIHLADPTRPVAKQLSRAIMRIDSHRVGLEHNLRERARLEEKLLNLVKGMRLEIANAGVGLVLLPQLIGYEELVPESAIPNIVEEEDGQKIFRKKRLPARPTLNLKVWT